MSEPALSRVNDEPAVGGENYPDDSYRKNVAANWLSFVLTYQVAESLDIRRTILEQIAKPLQL